MLSAVLLIVLLGLAMGVGWAAGRPRHRHRLGPLLDILQGVSGAVLCLALYALTGPLEHGAGEVLTVMLVGAWVSIGVSHATAAVLRRLSSGGEE